MLWLLEYLISGILLGSAAGISPGPLLVLVFSETLKYGKRGGIKVALSPLITDLPIVLLALFILSNFAGNNFLLGMIGLFGACYLIFLGVENLRTKVSFFGVEIEKSGGSLKRGVVANFLNPNPYVFWLSIGGPLIFKSLNIHVSATMLFILGFYSMLIGSKVLIALLVDKSKSFVQSKYFAYVIRALGVMLILFSLIFAKEGLDMIGLF